MPRKEQTPKKKTPKKKTKEKSPKKSEDPKMDEAELNRLAAIAEAADHVLVLYPGINSHNLTLGVRARGASTISDSLSLSLQAIF
jgi:hypothetical protein